MKALIMLLLIFIIISLIIIWIVTTFNKFQSHIVRINEAEANIDSVLRKRFDLLSKAVDVIKNNTGLNENVLIIIEKLRSRKLSTFEFDRKLKEALSEFENYKNKYSELKKIDEFVKIDIGINESEAEVVAFQKYYNDIITDYNRLVKSFPSNILALVFNFKYKTYFDGKDMTDKNIKDFKI